MDSNPPRNPVFLVFPPEIAIPEFQSTDFTATTYESSSPFPKLLAAKMKVLGTIQIVLGLMNFSFGVVFLFTFENPYPRFPFIFVSGYPFWSTLLFINSGAFLIALERKPTETLVARSRIMNFLSALAATAGIILLTFGFILDQHYFCGYSEEVSQCQPVTTLFIGILTMLMAFSIMELLIALSFSISKSNLDCCDSEA
ncbi:membrane-spanning 4-domains subfamily A member 5 [Equus przewalskii]|uniref:Membrane-spanning 4-domains subfamily A member 5 n=1 Tax=Equus przewalskii TaxID=9798 RepID=A0ABM2ETL4_EQUPR|nr:PREDICTED: membrane-spanning 4-domains subfamily A member 5 [Equus przewalskii]